MVYICRRNLFLISLTTCLQLIVNQSVLANPQLPGSVGGENIVGPVPNNAVGTGVPPLKPSNEVGAVVATETAVTKETVAAPILNPQDNSVATKAVETETIRKDTITAAAQITPGPPPTLGSPAPVAPVTVTKSTEILEKTQVKEPPETKPLPAFEVAKVNESAIKAIITTVAPVIKVIGPTGHPTLAATLETKSVEKIESVVPVVGAVIATTAPPKVLESNISVTITKVAPTQKLNDYLKPICESTSKVSLKQMFKIQTQFKQIVELTNGKLAFCFLEHYSFNPTLQPISIADLNLVCSSKSLEPHLKGSYKAFESCAEKNWDEAVNKHLDQIIAARINCTTNHQHGKVENGAVALIHEDDDISLINEVVSRVLGGDKSAAGKTDVRISDFSSANMKPITSSTVIPVISAAPSVILPSAAPPVVTALLSVDHTTSKPTARPKKAGLFSDPNTVLVFVDDSKTPIPSTTTKKPVTEKPVVKIEISAPAASTTAKPILLTSLITTLPTSVEPKTSKASKLLAHKILAAVSTVAPNVSVTIETYTSSTIKPDLIVATSATPSTTPKPAVSSTTTKKVEIVSKETKAVVVLSGGSTTKSPTSKSVVIKIKASVAPSTTSSPKVTSTTKPLSALEEVLKRQEKEKQELEAKLKAEREKLLKQLQKKQDESDTHSAIKVLQLQRDASSDHNSDDKLHQIEHERQMSIDPIGHTMKHQQYELVKQQKILVTKN